MGVGVEAGNKGCRCGTSGTGQSGTSKCGTGQGGGRPVRDRSGWRQASVEADQCGGRPVWDRSVWDRSVWRQVGVEASKCGTGQCGTGKCAIGQGGGRYQGMQVWGRFGEMLIWVHHVVVKVFD